MTSPLRRRIRHARRFFGYGALVLLILAATLVGGLNQLLPLVERHPDKVAAWLGERIGEPVSFTRAVGEWTRRGPRFTGENLEANLTLAAKVREIADEKGITPAQLALAWVLARGEDLVPIPGTKRRTYLEQNAGAVDVELTEDELARIDAELPRAAGDRYDEAGMATLNL